MANLHGSFIWYELISPDPDASKTFYDQVVGWNIEAQPAGEMDYRMIRRADGGNSGGVMRLTDAMCSNGARPMWLGYLGVDDVDATLAAVVDKGGKVVMAPWDAAEIGRIAMVGDPQGIPFYIIKPTPPAGQEGIDSDVFSETAPGRVSWNELRTPDQAAALDFYRSLFDFDEAGRMPMGEAGDYIFWTHHGVRIGAVMQCAKGDVGGWTFVFRVASANAAALAIASGGGDVVMGKHQVPGGDWLVIANDPHGARFAVIGGE